MASIILAKILGLYYLGIGITFIANSGRIVKAYRLIMGNEALLLLSGIIALLFGATILSVHNVWVLSWPVLITVIGWLSFFKGLCLMAWSEFTSYFSFMFGKSNLFYRIVGISISLLGLFFIYHGWK